MIDATAAMLLILAFLSIAVGGVFLSFSDFVMRGLALASPSAGAEAMQQINRTVYRSFFLTSFLLLVPLTIASAIYALLQLDGTARTMTVVAAVIYLLGSFLVTVLGNVPMNQRLDRLSADGEGARDYWAQYCVRWTRLNHLRTAGCFSTGVLYLLAAGTYAGAVGA